MLERLEPNRSKGKSRSVPIGSCKEMLNGDEYQATFKGKGWVSADQDDGDFLSDHPYAKAHPTDPDTGLGLGMKGRKQFTMAQLFPENWQEARVEYEITVRAKKISP